MCISSRPGARNVSSRLEPHYEQTLDGGQKLTGAPAPRSQKPGRPEGYGSLRVPGVYLTWANSQFLTVSSFIKISNLRALNVALSSIPTAPTNLSLSLQK